MDLLKGALLGGVLGIVLALVACVVFSKTGWYDLRGRFARGLRWTTFTLTILLAGFFFGIAGLWQGAMRGSERVLTQSQLATSAFPEIGNTLADGMAWIQLRAHSGSNTDATLTVGLEAFRTGKWELHATRFLQELDDFQATTITNLVVQLEQTALERAPQLKGGIGEQLLHELLNGLARRLVEQKVIAELKTTARIVFTKLSAPNCPLKQPKPAPQKPFPERRFPLFSSATESSPAFYNQSASLPARSNSPCSASRC
ncbi:MAG: hypothetical protein QM813_19940 [Verrucomicrobiota bacterium]